MTQINKYVYKTKTLSDGCGKEDKYFVQGRFVKSYFADIRINIHFSSGSISVSLSKRKWFDLIKFMKLILEKKRFPGEVFSGIDFNDRRMFDKRIIFGMNDPSYEESLLKKRIF